MAADLSIQKNKIIGDSTLRWGRVSRTAMVFLGVVLILSGGIKALDLNLFVHQIQSYGLITQPVITALAAWAITTVECLLGTALLVNYRPRQALNLTLLLLTAFTLLTLSAAIRGSVEDCGCFGALVKRTPLQAVIEDGVLLFFTLIARWGLIARQGAQTSAKTWPSLRVIFVVAAALSGATLPFFSGVPSALLGDQGEGAREIWADLQVAGVDGIALNKDTHLVVLMSASCQHCQEAVPELAMLMDELKSQPLLFVGLGQDNSEALQDFIAEWAPPYPIGRIAPDAFWTLLGDADLPRIFLVKAGRTLNVWDGAVPTANEITQLLSQ